MKIMKGLKRMRGLLSDRQRPVVGSERRRRQPCPTEEVTRRIILERIAHCHRSGDFRARDDDGVAIDRRLRRHEHPVLARDDKTSKRLASLGNQTAADMREAQADLVILYGHAVPHGPE